MKISVVEERATSPEQIFMGSVSSRSAHRSWPVGRVGLKLLLQKPEVQVGNNVTGFGVMKASGFEGVMENI